MTARAPALEADFYVEIAPTDYHRNSTHITARAMRVTLAPPRKVRPGWTVVKLKVRLPREAFEPPEIVVNVPKRALRGRGTVVAEATV